MRKKYDLWYVVAVIAALVGIYRWTQTHTVAPGGWGGESVVVSQHPIQQTLTWKSIDQSVTTWTRVPPGTPQQGEKVLSGTKSQQKNIPAYVLQTLQYVRRYHRAPDGYEWWRTFMNYQRVLPYADAAGKRIKYQERDVHPRVQWVNRGAERLVTSSKDAYFTADHYSTFMHIIE